MPSLSAPCTILFAFGLVTTCGCSPPAPVRGLPVTSRSAELTTTAQRHPPAPAPAIPPWQAQAEHDADAALRSIHAQLLACYARRLKTHPTAHAYLTVDVLLGADGRPREVTTTGGALLGSDVIACVRRNVSTAPFAPPRGGGTARVRVPLSFHPDAVGADG